MKRLLLWSAGLLLLAACSGGSSLSVSVISTINTVGTGEQRVMVELRNAEGELVTVDGAPLATLRDENGSPVDESEGELVWVIPDEQPAYALYFDIPLAETYQLTVDGGELGESSPTGFIAVENPVQVKVGELAPPITGPDVIGPAIAVFATPEWCPSRSCQPMIDTAQEAVGPTEDVGFVQVDVFEDPDVESEADLVLSPDVAQWGLPSQPWLYVIDETARIAALFEGAVSPDELERALALVTG